MPQPQILPEQIAGGGTPEAAGITSGNATLSAGQVNINTNAVKTDSVILLSTQTPGGTVGSLRVSFIYEYVGGPSGYFTIASSSASDSSTVSWSIMNP